MDPSFIPIETVPSKTPFGLDQLRRSYKTPLDAASAIAAAPNVGDADETFPNMFLMPISTPESAESATRIDLTYMGCFGGADGSPVLPDQKTGAEDAVQSASSSRSSVGLVANPAVTVQFYAPTETLSYFSFGSPGTDTASDPAADIQVITITLGDSTLAISNGTDEFLVSVFFSVQILETHKSTEVVPGKYWQNESRKVKSLSPWIFVLPPGPYVTLYTPGTGYTVGDNLTITGSSGLAHITITSVGISNSISAWTQTSNTFTAAQNMIPGSGGTGTGAEFNVIIVI